MFCWLYAKQTDIAVYFTASVIAYLIITVLFIYLTPRTRRTLSMVSNRFFSWFHGSGRPQSIGGLAYQMNHG